MKKFVWLGDRYIKVDAIVSILVTECFYHISLIDGKLYLIERNEQSENIITEVLSWG